MTNDPKQPKDDLQPPLKPADDSADADLKLKGKAGRQSKERDEEETRRDSSDAGLADAETKNADYAYGVSPDQSTMSPQEAETKPAIGFSHGAFPSQIGQYEMQDVLGEGGMGVVFRAYDTHLRRAVAFKTIRPSSRQQGFIDRLQREARLLAQLDHPHIVRILDFGKQEDRAWLAMELLSGETLADRMREGGDNDHRRVAELVLQIARAVGYCHTAGIVHRDLKPANVLVDEAGKLKVTDFGLGRSTANESRLTRSGDVVGTLQYMAPEQATGAVRQIRPSSDVYALGVILYELLTGGPPFADDDPLRTITRILAEEPKAPRRIREEIPAELETICLKCLEKKAANRYADANELADDLQRYLSHAAIEAKPASFVQRATRLAFRHPVISSAALLTLVFLVCGLFALAAHNQQLQSELDRSQRLVNRSREFSNWLLYEFSETLEAPSGVTAVRAEMVDRIVEHLNDTLEDAEADSQLRFDLGKAYVRVAHLQGNPETFNLGQPAAALESLDMAEQLLNSPTEDSDLQNRQLYMRAMVAEGRGDIAVSTDKPARAKQYYQAGLEHLDALESRAAVELADADERMRRWTLRSNLLIALADLSRRSQELEQAFERLQEASKLFTPELVKQAPLAKARLQLRLAQTMEDAGQYEQAVKLWDAGLKTLAPLSKGDATPLNVEQPEVAGLLGRAGSLLQLRKFDEAQASYARALERNAKMLSRDSNNRMLQRQRALILRDVVTAKMGKGMVEEDDAALLREAVAISESLAADPSNHAAREDLVYLNGFVGSYYLMSFAPDSAEPAFQKQKEMAQKMIADQLASPGLRQALAEAEMGLGSCDSLRMSAKADEHVKAAEAGEPAPPLTPDVFAKRAVEHFMLSTQLFEDLRKRHGLSTKQQSNATAVQELLEMHRKLLTPEEL